MYKMNHRTDIVKFLGGRLLERGAYFENLTFWRGAYWRGALIREWARIRSFTVLMIKSSNRVDQALFNFLFNSFENSLIGHSLFSS